MGDTLSSAGWYIGIIVHKELDTAHWKIWAINSNHWKFNSTSSLHLNVHLLTNYWIWIHSCTQKLVKVKIHFDIWRHIFELCCTNITQRCLHIGVWWEHTELINPELTSLHLPTIVSRIISWGTLSAGRTLVGHYCHETIGTLLQHFCVNLMHLIIWLEK